MRLKHPPADPVEIEACRALAVTRWGPTGWLCPDPECGCTQGRHLRTRPRVVQCCDCGIQRSVTGKTAFAYTKLAVSRVIPAFAAAIRLASVTQIQQDFGVARSTAWHLLQRTLRVMAHAFDSVTEPDDGWHWRQEFRFRPTGRKPLPLRAPPDLRSAQENRIHTWFPVRLDRYGPLLQLRRIGAMPRDKQHELGEHGKGVLGIRKYLCYHLSVRREVSLRWAPRWVAALLADFSYPDALCVPTIQSWLTRAEVVGHSPLATLEPWRTWG